MVHPYHVIAMKRNELLIHTTCVLMDCCPPWSFVHGVFQARLLKWVAISFSGGLPDPGIKPGSPALQDDALPSEPPEKPTTNTKGTYIVKKYKQRKKDLQNQPQTIKKVAIGTYISIITSNVNGLNTPTKRHRLTEWIQNKTHIYAVYKKSTSDLKTHMD